VVSPRAYPIRFISCCWIRARSKAASGLPLALVILEEDIRAAWSHRVIEEGTDSAVLLVRSERQVNSDRDDVREG